MDFLKKHYEKIILTLVLLGGAAAVIFMPVQLSGERGRIEEQRQMWFGDRVNKFKPAELSTNEAVLARAQTNNEIELARQHNVFNPVKWLKHPNGALIKVQTGDEIGARAVSITRLEPLRLVVAFEQVQTTSDPFRYVISVLSEVDKATPDKRLLAKAQQARFGNNDLRLLDVQGPDPAKPVALLVLLNKETEPLRITEQKPYERVIGYSADLFYGPENSTRKNVRKGNSLKFGDETYNIVAINEREVVLSASSNQKQTVIRFDPNARTGGDTNAPSGN